MKRHDFTMYETPFTEEIKEGVYRVIFDKNGLIKDIQQRVSGKLKSVLAKDEEAEQAARIAAMNDILDDDFDDDLND